MNSLNSFLSGGTKMFMMVSSMPEIAITMEGASAKTYLQALSAVHAAVTSLVQSLLQRTSASFDMIPVLYQAVLQLCSHNDTAHNSHPGASNYLYGKEHQHPTRETRGWVELSQCKIRSNAQAQQQ